MNKCGRRTPRNWSPDQFAPHIWVEDSKGIYSHVECLGQVDQVEPVPPQIIPQSMSTNLKACQGHRHVAVDSIEGTIRLDSFQFRNPSNQRCRLITSLGVCIATEHHCARWQLAWQSSFALWQIFVFNPAECLATLITRKAWLKNRFSRQWTERAAGSNELHGTNSTHSVTWYKFQS